YNPKDKDLFSSVPDDLKNVSDKELIDHLRERQKTIYDHDRRLDYPEFASNGDYARVAESVAAFISPDQYHIDGKELRITAKSLSATRSVCSDQPYSGQPAASFCTGFVVGPDVVATAGHCIKDNWKSSRIVFGYRMLQNGSLSSISTTNVYAPTLILAQKVEGGGEDYAMLRVDRVMD